MGAPQEEEEEMRAMPSLQSTLPDELQMSSFAMPNKEMSQTTTSSTLAGAASGPPQHHQAVLGDDTARDTAYARAYAQRSVEDSAAAIDAEALSSIGDTNHVTLRGAMGHGQTLPWDEV